MLGHPSHRHFHKLRAGLGTQATGGGRGLGQVCVPESPAAAQAGHRQRYRLRAGLGARDTGGGAGLGRVWVPGTPAAAQA
eukprot:639562-Alexandrium_andersonii.AAC.1